ncbi:hypothetical protein VCRA2126O85_420037 [Vibrio crassostreae]|nr:hypothetical protein VCRA2128O106_410039 [Vibrio crassostreae]CAK2954225.1 hypothetical protein VCRA2125O83_410038 [Vibrio crassostreae]CAK2954775.1 hypothetical protein VCRA2127O91_420012 [Vibrio crassostreae]CAK2955494.1 hypothetical protein VCRA2128O100_430038 [Vibrio crassostreae]CAK2955703.1 hypothetical protein VCRA2126O86_420037 [Vibrio crassostreae]
MRDAKRLRVDASKWDARYEERKGQMRVNEMRKTKKAELDNLALLLVFSLLSFSHLDYSNPVSALKS